MLIRMNQRGEGKLGCIFGLLVLIAAVFVAYKMIPVKVRATEFRDAVTDAARSAAGQPTDGIKNALAYKAVQLRLPVAEKDIKIDRRSDYITIEVEYTVPVEFPGFTYQWKFNPRAENPLF